MCNRDPKISRFFRDTEPEVKLVQRVVACENAKWIVSLDHISGSVEVDIPNYIVVHPKITHHNLVSGVCILPVFKGHIGLVRYYRHPIEESLWEVPRGFIDWGETPEQAAIRELREETGFICDPANITSLGYYLPEPSTLRARGALFVAEMCQQPGRREVSEEHGLGELALFPADKVFEMISTSKIQDASSLITCYRYRARLQEQQERL